MGESRSPAEFSKKSNMVLVVEDDTEMRELLRIELEAEGFTILTATNGAQAMSTARTEQPEVILMDVQMPVMNGVEAAEILKDDHDTRHIPIIMITALERKEDIIKGFEAGAIDYITKPFFLPELKARVNAVLRLKNIYDELIAMRERLIKDEMLNLKFRTPLGVKLSSS
jgi:DNA-binding response OmpR family regulator